MKSANGLHRPSYAEQHFVDGVAEAYETDYHPSSYHTAIWALQRPFLREVLRSVRARSGRLKYLDFACGTGRIISGVEDVATESIGTDISTLMLSHAARRTSSPLRCGDILRSPTLVDHDYDAITAFRFFLGTDAETRLPVMRDLAGRLRGVESRLIFNIPWNSRSALALTDAYRRVRGWPAFMTISRADIRRLTADAGLDIVATRGFGLVPRRLYRTSVTWPAHAIDSAASRIGMLSPLGQDMVYVCRLRPTPENGQRP